MSEETKPRIVKSHDINLDSDYVNWIHDVKQRYISTQIKAAVKVNTERLYFNWQLGRDLVERKAEEKWGKGIVEQLSLDLLVMGSHGRSNVESAFAGSVVMRVAAQGSVPLFIVR